MSIVYIVKNQHGLFVSKQKEWVDGREPKILFRSPHKDEAINLVFELSSKDIYIRAEAIKVELDDNKQPIVEVTAEAPIAVTAEDLNNETDNEDRTTLSAEHSTANAQESDRDQVTSLGNQNASEY